MKKKKENPIEHEEQYIKYLEEQIKYFKKLHELSNVGDYTKQTDDLKYKLSKARMILKLLTK